MGWSTTGTSCLARRGPKLLSILVVPYDHASKNVSYVRNYSFTYIEFKVLHFIEYEYTIAYVYCLCQRGVSARYQDSFRLPSDPIQISSSAIGIKIRVLQTEHDTPGSSIFTCTLPRKYMTLSISGGILRVSDLWSRSYWKDSERPFACFWTKSSGTCQFVRADRKGFYFIYVVLLCYIYIYNAYKLYLFDNF